MEVSTALFTYDRFTKQFTAEISNLGKSFHFEALYEDSCDTGLVLRSHKTEKTARFYVADQKDNDGEIWVWILKPTSDTLKKHPQLRDIEIHILND